MNYEQNKLQTPNVITNTIGANSLISRGAHLWNTLPDDMKNVNSTATLKERLKNGIGINATARFVSKQIEVIVRS